MFRRYHPETTVSLEQNTVNVPHDNRCYILYEGKMVTSYRALKTATEKYEEIFARLGVEAKGEDPDQIKNHIQRMILEDDLIQADIFRSTKHLRRTKQGKLQHR